MTETILTGAGSGAPRTIERTPGRVGFRIEEDDADGLRSVEAVTQFLVIRSGHVGQQA